MAFSTTTEWDVRTTGSDSNGGGFDVASSGTDYSQQDSAQVTYTDLAIDATTNTKVTSSGTPFTSVHVGNIINITSGTGFTVQRVQVVSVTSNVATCDKSLGTLSSTGGHGTLGGSLATLSTANGVQLAGGRNAVHLKSGTYTHTSSITFASGLHVVGYTTSHWDGASTRPLITTATNSTKLFLGSGNITGIFEYINFSNTAGTRSYGFYAQSADSVLVIAHCTFDGFLVGVYGEFTVDFAFTQLTLIDVEVKNSTNEAVRNTYGSFLWGCYLHDNGGHGYTDGIYTGAAGLNLQTNIMNCTIVNNGGNGIYQQRTANTQVWKMYSNTIAKNTGDGIKFTQTMAISGINTLVGNIIALNTGKGLNLPASSKFCLEGINVVYSNTGGDTTVFTYQTPITLSGDPFTNSGSKDYTLNNTTGAGALLRGVGVPDSALGSMGNYNDVGAIMHLASGGGILRHPGMGGGING